MAEIGKVKISHFLVDQNADYMISDCFLLGGNANKYDDITIMKYLAEIWNQKLASGTVFGYFFNEKGKFTCCSPFSLQNKSVFLHIE